MKNLPERKFTELKRSYPVMSLEDILGKIRKECSDFTHDTYGAGDHTLVFLPGATAELEQLVYWGGRYPVNIFEQQFQGVGHIYDSNGSYTIIVSHFLYIYSASRGATHARIFEDANDTMLSRLERERGIYNAHEVKYNKDRFGRPNDPFAAENNLSEVVLMGHTHPDLGCFFSPTDRGSNCATPTIPVATFVCDPIRRDMKAMVGIKESSARIIVLRPSPGNKSCGKELDYYGKTAPAEVSAVLLTVSRILEQPGYKGKCTCTISGKDPDVMELNVSIKRKAKRGE